MRNAYDILEERGLVKQCSHPEELRELMGKEKLTFYIGFDPTADSLHIGHYIPIMAMAHLQKAGHKPYALMGGGTGMIGDPSGKSDLRKVLTVEDIDSNVAKIKQQMSHFLDFDESRENCAVIVNNADWLRSLNYIDFLRDVGALWLDPNKCSPYDFYQYWRNVDDADVEKCLGLLTFLPMDEVRRLGALLSERLGNKFKIISK